MDMTDTASMNHDLRAAAVRHIAPRLDSLERLQRLCDRWIGRHTEQFDLFTWHTTAERFRRRKAFAEAAFYLYVCHPLGDDDGELQELRTLIVDRVNDPRYGALVARHPRDFDLYCPGPLYVSARGELGDGTTAALTDILRSRAIWAIPRRPS